MLTAMHNAYQVSGKQWQLSLLLSLILVGRTDKTALTAIPLRKLRVYYSGSRRIFLWMSGTDAGRAMVV